MKNTFKDINRDDYLRILLADACKQAHVNDIPERAERILDYVVTNPSNADKGSKKPKLPIENGYLVVTRKD